MSVPPLQPVSYRMNTSSSEGSPLFARNTEDSRSKAERCFEACINTLFERDSPGVICGKICIVCTTVTGLATIATFSGIALTTENDITRGDMIGLAILSLLATLICTYCGLGCCSRDLGGRVSYDLPGGGAAA